MALDNHCDNCYSSYVIRKRISKMYKVTYKIYGKYVKENQFDSYEAAVKFFWSIQKSSKVTSTNLVGAYN